MAIYSLQDIIEDASEYLEIGTFSDVSRELLIKHINKVLSNLYPKLYELVTITDNITEETELPYFIDLPEDIEKICRIRLYAPGTYNGGNTVDGYIPLYNWESEYKDNDDPKVKANHKRIEFFKEGWTGKLVIKCAKVLKFDNKDDEIELRNDDVIIHYIASWYWKKLSTRYLRTADRGNYKLFSNASVDEMKLAEYKLKSMRMGMLKEDTAPSGPDRHRAVMQVVNYVRPVSLGRLS